MASTQPDSTSVAIVSRRSAASAASGRSHSRYHGTSHAEQSRIASVAHPAMRIGSAPRQVRHSVQAATTRNARANSARTGSRSTPSSSATLYGSDSFEERPWFELSSENDSKTSVPNPISPSTTRPTAAPSAPAIARHIRGRDASTRYGTTSAADALIPAAAVDHAPVATGRPDTNAYTPAIVSSRTSASLCAADTTCASTSGLSPTSSAGARGSRPSRSAARHTSATTPSDASAVTTFSTQYAPATPSGPSR